LFFWAECRSEAVDFYSLLETRDGQVKSFLTGLGNFFGRWKLDLTGSFFKLGVTWLDLPISVRNTESQLTQIKRKIDFISEKEFHLILTECLSKLKRWPIKWFIFVNPQCGKDALVELSFSSSWHRQSSRCVHSAWISCSRHALDRLHEVQVTHEFSFKKCNHKFSSGFKSLWS
jgi:hypothetical protein